MPVTTIRGGRQITDGTIPYVDIQQVVANRLVGNPTGTAAAMSEISLGTGLSFSGGSVALSANLQSLSGLSYSSAAFVKMTAAGTFALDTATYLTSETDTLSSVTGRGATTATAISLTNSTATSSASTGALIVTGGVGVGGSVWIGTNLTTGGLTMGQGITNQNIYLNIQNPGIGYGNGFNFVRGTDGAGIRVIETSSDATMYEMWMSDNPDGGDMMQWRFDDWQSANGLTVPIHTTGRTNRYAADTHYIYGTIIQSTVGFFTTNNTGGTNGSDRQLIFNTVSKLRLVGSTVDITGFNVANYNSTSGNLFWIKLDSTTTFAWGYGSPASTATVSGIALSTSAITLANGIQVTFSATTGVLGDTFAARVFRAPANTFGPTTATSFVKSGGTASQFLKADGSVDANTYLTGNQSISVTGDASGSGTTSIALTLATVNSNIGTFNNVTVNAKGLVTAASNVAYITGNQSITLSGDVSGTGTTAITATLATVTQSTGANFVKITLDTKGRVTGNTAVAASDLHTTYGSQTANTFYAAPNGAAGNPSFRAIVAADIPALNYQAVLNGTGFVKATGTTISYDNTTYQSTAEKGVANGYASLNSSGQVPSTQLPSYVDDVLEYANLAAFPVTGEAGKIYVTADTNKTYRWTGTVYVEISASPGSTDAVTEGTTNLYFTNARARAALSFTAGSGAYNSSTGVFTIPTNTNQLTNGAGFITGESDTLATVTGRGASTSIAVALNGGATIAGLTVSGNIGFSGTERLITLGQRNRLVFSYQTFGTVDSGSDRGGWMWNAYYDWTVPGYKFMNTNSQGAAILKITNNTLEFSIKAGASTADGSFTWDNTYTVYHSGNLTNLNQLTNGPGYTTNTGTVTSVAALTLGTTGTDLSSSVATGTTTAVITLNVPTASAANRGALSAADWSTFNGKQAALNGTGFVKATGTTISYDNSTYALSSHTHSYFIGTTAVQTSSANQAITGITGITFAAEASDSASITSTISGSSTFFDFNLTDDNNNDEWRWRFTPSGQAVYNAMRLVPVSNTAANLIVSGTIASSNFSGTSSGTNTGDQTITLTGNVTGSGTGSFATTIANGVVTNAMLANSSFNIGTTAISLGRASAAQSLTGINIDGTAGSTKILAATDNSVTTQGGNGNIIYSYAIASNAAGLFTASDNANAIFTVSRHPGSYYSQLGFSSNGNLYYRNFVNTAIDTSQAWQTIWTSSSLTNLNQLTNGPGYVTGGPYLPLAGGTVSGATTFSGTLYSRKDQTANDYTTAALWTESYGNTATGIAFHISGVVGRMLYMNTTDANLYWNGTALVYNSGTWGINITGNAATATFLKSAFPYNINITDSTTAASLSEPGSLTSVSMHASHGYFSGYATTLTMSGYDRYGVYQISGLYNAAVPDLVMRNYYQGTSDYTAWTRILSSANYNSYAPSLGGTGASGTWGINVTGHSNKLSVTSISNVNTERAAGYLEYYDVNGATGAPASGWHSYISVRHGNASNQYGFQFANGFGNDTLYFRGWDGTNPTAWRTVWTSGSLTNLNQLTNGPGYITGSYIATTGDNYGAGNYEFASSNESSTSYSVAAVELRESNRGGTIGYLPPRLAFHWGGVVASQISIESNGRIVIRDNPGTGYQAFAAATITAYGNIVASGDRPITLNITDGAIFIQGSSGGWATGTYFKGSAGTTHAGFGALGSADSFSNLWIGAAYNSTWMTFTSSAVNSQVALQQGGNQVLHAANYNSYAPTLTGTGASGTWGININGIATLANGANGNFYIDDNYGNTVVGVYSDVRYQGVFAMGDSYKLPADGTTTGSLYGLAWSHPNAGGVAANLNTHGLLVMENGAFLAAISGSIRARDDMRAPQFRLTNSTNNAYFTGDANWGAKLQTDNGYIQIGPANASYGHIYTDRGQFYFNKDILINNVQVVVNSGTWGISITGDAGSVDGIDSSRIVYGDGARGKSVDKTSGNANTSDSSNPSGFFFGNSTTGMPTTDWWTWINTAGNSWSGGDGYGFQLAHSFWGDDLKVRRLQSGTWYSWLQVLTSGNISSYAITSLAGETLAAVTARGATTTAAITVNGNLTVGNTTNSYIYMTDTDETTRSIHCNSNRIGFLTSSSSWGSYCDNSGNWTSVGDITAYSDARVKENVSTIENALEKTLALRGVTYTRKDTEDKSRKVGVIAQEIQKVLPEVVSEQVDGMLGVSYGNIVGVLIEAIKEQQTQIEDLKKQIQYLVENR